jgi:hypothetical protein
MQLALKLEALLSRCRKLRYYSQFVPEFTEEIHLFGVYDSTDHDGDKHVYQCASVPPRQTPRRLTRPHLPPVAIFSAIKTLLCLVKQPLCFARNLLESVESQLTLGKQSKCSNAAIVIGEKLIKLNSIVFHYYFQML